MSRILTGASPRVRIALLPVPMPNLSRPSAMSFRVAKVPAVTLAWRR